MVTAAIIQERDRFHASRLFKKKSAPTAVRSASAAAFFGRGALAACRDRQLAGGFLDHRSVALAHSAHDQKSADEWRPEKYRNHYRDTFRELVREE